MSKRKLSGVCFHCSHQSTSHNHAPDTIFFFSEVTVYFVTWRVGIHLLNLASDIGGHGKRLSGQLLLIFPPFVQCQCLFSSACPEQKCACITLALPLPFPRCYYPEHGPSSKRWNGTCSWIEKKAMMLLPTQILCFSVLNPCLSSCFHEYVQNHFRVSCSGNFFVRLWCTQNASKGNFYLWWVCQDHPILYWIQILCCLWKPEKKRFVIIGD